MLTPIRQLPLTEAQRQTALAHNILAMDRESAALFHQPERGNGVYLLDRYDQLLSLIHISEPTRPY